MNVPDSYTRIKAKCLQCDLHFAICTWYPERHERETLYCPECGQRLGWFVVYSEQVSGQIYTEVPGQAKLIQMPTPTQASAQSTPTADNASIDKPPGGSCIPVAQLIAIAMLAWALVPDNPYGYYILLRFAVCGISAYLAYKAFELNCIGWGWALIAVAVVYNPIIRVHLNREIWSVVNVVTIIAFALSMWILRGAKPESNSEIL